MPNPNGIGNTILVMKKKTKVSVGDDQKLFRDGLTALLEPFDQFEINYAQNGIELNSIHLILDVM